MARKLIVNLLNALTVLVVISALFHFSLGRRSRKFSCLQCKKICGKGQNYWGALGAYCNRCATTCDSTKIADDPWLKVSMISKQIKNGTAPEKAVLDIESKSKVPASKGETEGRSISDAAESPPFSGRSGMSWWGR